MKLLRYFFQGGGIGLIFRNGSQLWERTPEHMTGAEHLESLKRRYGA